MSHATDHFVVCRAGFGGARPFNYFVFGTAVSEVELDTLTGDWQLLRSDIVMDVGNPINPAIDIGQVGYL
jgi:xanthine dehydrogenase/oxidase